MTSASPRILHCLPEAGSVSALAQRIAGLEFEAHHFLSLTGQEVGQLDALYNDAGLAKATDIAPVAGRPSPGRLNALAQSLARYDLVLTYGWDSINVALAHRVFAQHLGLPNLIHHELDFGVTEELPFKRRFLRRIAHGSTDALVTSAGAVGQFAHENWSLSESSNHTIYPGIDLKHFRPSAKADALPGLVKRSKEHWIGAISARDDAVNANVLIDVMSELPGNWQLVLYVERGGADSLRAAAQNAELSHRVHLLDASFDQTTMLALCDIYVELAGPYSAPSGTMKAMAAANPILSLANSEASNAVGHVEGNIVFDKFEFGNLSKALLSATNGRENLAGTGKGNREYALKEFGANHTAKRFGRLYQSLLRA